MTREECHDDRRGYFAVLTDKGHEALVAAAPVHVDSVRRRIVDVLTPEEFTGPAQPKLVDALGE